MILADSAYLDLLKKCLTASIYDESSWQVVDGPMRHETGLLPSLKRSFISALKQRGLRIVRSKKFDADARAQGLDWPLFGLTMAGTQRLNNLKSCIEDILAKNVPGCFVQTGV